MMEPDFTPVAENISLHGLGFIQVKLPDNRRLHVWHPELPRRNCYEHSAIHNHRFSFNSIVLKGTQINRRYMCISDSNMPLTHTLISHNGPRSPKGGRESFEDGQVHMMAKAGGDETIHEGHTYYMRELEYHETPNSGIVITLMRKLSEGMTHAHSAIEIGHEFHQDFDRFQLSPDELWHFVRRAFEE